MVHDVLVFLVKALAFVGVLGGGWLAAGAVRKIVAKLLVRAGFDKAVERGGVRAALARSQHDASDIVAKLVFYAVMLFALRFAFGIWGPNPVSALLASVIGWLPQGFVAIVIVVVAAAIGRAVKDVIASALDGLAYARPLANGASVLIIGLGVIAALDQVGVAAGVTTPVLIAVLATIGGVIVVGVGGGLVRPMQDRWEDWLERAEDAAPALAAQARAYEQGRRDAAAAQAALLAEAEARAAERADTEAAERTDAEHADIEATMVISPEATQRLP
jgi:hypothetical protein